MQTEWSDAALSAPLNRIDDFLDTAKGQSLRATLLSIFVDLTPRLYDASKEFMVNREDAPVTELTIMPIPSPQSLEDQKATHEAFINLRAALTQQTNGDSDLQARYWSQGYIQQPGTISHEESPTQRASLFAMVIGWESKEQHEKARNTDSFKKTITSVREKRLTKGTEMYHVKFRTI
jgi:heme-degrading monooxygenase HmoA